MTQVLLATSNPGKVLEYETLFEGLPVKWLLPSDLGINLDVEETGQTFEENARLKAVAFAETSKMPAFADDSGLVVDALGGAPGVRSARYAGPGASDEDRYRLLLSNMAAMPQQERGAHFVCVVALAMPGGSVISAEGRCEGRIIEGPQGEGGFGYDPVFWVSESGRTMAQLGPGEKNRVGHRGRAVAAIRAGLVEVLGLHAAG